MSKMMYMDTQYAGVTPVPDEFLSTIFLVGKIDMYAGSAAPAGWLMCDGRAVSRAAYPELFSVIGTTYGAGDGSTTFNVPDFRGKMPLGVSSSHPLSGDGSTGGEETVKLADSDMAHGHGFTQPTVNGGSHRHSYTARTGDAAYGIGGGAYGFPTFGSSNTGYDGGHTHTVKGGAVSNLGTPSSRTYHNNMPPYRSINFIIYAGRLV